MTPIENLSFEEALQALEEIVQKLETGNINLEDSISYYERGMALKQHCEAKLRTASLRVEKITLGNEGEIKVVEMI